MSPSDGHSVKKRKQPDAGSDRSYDSTDDEISTKAAAAAIPAAASVIRPARAAFWNPPSGATSSFLRASSSSSQFASLGANSTSSPAKRARHSVSPISSPGHSGEMDTSFGSGESRGADDLPAVHHMFDVTGRVPPPPEVTHDDSDMDEEYDEDMPNEEVPTDEYKTQSPKSRAEETSVVPVGGAQSSTSSQPQSKRPDSSHPGKDAILEATLTQEISPATSEVNSTRPMPVVHQEPRANLRKMSISNLMSPHETSGDEGILQRAQTRASMVDGEQVSGSTMVTLYLEDKRPQEPDYQIAEISVALSPGPLGSAVWMASSQEVVDKLQSGASCIDGPAKVFCHRRDVSTGKLWKHCILRIADGECVPSTGSIQIPENLQLELVIEKYPPVIIRPPVESSAGPSKGIQARASSSTNRQDGRVAIPPTPASLRPIPRPSLIPGMDKIRERSPQQHPNAHWPKPKGSVGQSIAATVTTRGVTLTNENKSSKSRKAMADYVRPLIQADPFWPSFHESKGHVKSNADAVKCLRFFEDIVKKYDKQLVPNHIPYAGGRRLTKASLLEAVGRGTTWGSDCHIVLGLVERFGPDGPDENPEVVELLQNTSGDKKGGIADFVARMKKIRDEHVKKVGQAGGNQAVQSPATSGGSRGTPATP